jgi:hypothetical protein
MREFGALDMTALMWQGTIINMGVPNLDVHIDEVKRQN